MIFNKDILQSLVVRVDVTDYVRVVPRAYAATPLGMGYGKTRFSSPKDRFKLLYLAEDSQTSLAETLIRDRFQGANVRQMAEAEIYALSIAVVGNPQPLNLIDLRGRGPTVLGVPTDTVLGRAQAAGRAFSQRLYDQTDLDGIAYHSRLTRRDCVAVYDRAVSKLSAPGAALELERLGSLTADLAALNVRLIGDPKGH
jgi:hypothetical protein